MAHTITVGFICSPRRSRSHGRYEPDDHAAHDPDRPTGLRRSGRLPCGRPSCGERDPSPHWPRPEDDPPRLRSAEPPRYRRAPRPSKLDPFRDESDRLLRCDPRVPGKRIRELIEELRYEAARRFSTTICSSLRARYPPWDPTSGSSAGATSWCSSTCLSRASRSRSARDRRSRRGRRSTSSRRPLRGLPPGDPKRAAPGGDRGRPLHLVRGANTPPRRAPPRAPARARPASARWRAPLAQGRQLASGSPSAAQGKPAAHRARERPWVSHSSSASRSSPRLGRSRNVPLDLPAPDRGEAERRLDHFLAAVGVAQPPAFTPSPTAFGSGTPSCWACFDEPTTNGYAVGVINRSKLIKHRATACLASTASGSESSCPRATRQCITM
jgi:hypothetical protein